MDDAELAVYQHHTERTAEPLEPFRETALVVGRRGGKSRILALVAVYLACFRDYTPYLGCRRGRDGRGHLRQPDAGAAIFRYTLGLLEAVPALKKMVKDDTADQIVLNNRVVIEIHTASFRVTRGYTLAAVLADETAFWRDESSSEL